MLKILTWHFTAATMHILRLHSTLLYYMALYSLVSSYLSSIILISILCRVTLQCRSTSTCLPKAISSGTPATPSSSGGWITASAPEIRPWTSVTTVSWADRHCRHGGGQKRSSQIIHGLATERQRRTRSAVNYRSSAPPNRSSLKIFWYCDITYLKFVNIV